MERERENENESESEGGFLLRGFFCGDTGAEGFDGCGEDSYDFSTEPNAQINCFRRQPMLEASISPHGFLRRSPRNNKEMNIFLFAAAAIAFLDV